MILVACKSTHTSSEEKLMVMGPVFFLEFKEEQNGTFVFGYTYGHIEVIAKCNNDSQLMYSLRSTRSQNETEEMKVLGIEGPISITYGGGGSVPVVGERELKDLLESPRSGVYERIVDNSYLWML